MPSDLETLREQGWVVLPDVLSPAEVEAYRNAVMPVVEANGRGRTDFEGRSTDRVYALLGKCPEIAALAEHPRVLELGDAVMKPGYLLSSAQAVRIHEGESAQGLHADDDPVGFDRPREPLGFSTMWALTDFTTENGATRLVPGSHRKDSTWPDEAEAVSATMAAGSVLVYLGGVEHGGGAHLGGPPRLGISIIYCQPWMRQFENLMVATPRDVARTFSERLQRMLGYGMLGVWGSVDGRDPMKLLED